MYTDISTEQEAAIGLLLSSVKQKEEPLSQSRIETISRILVLCTKFREQNVNESFRKVYQIAEDGESQDFVLYCASLISEEFAPTLFAMCCETALADGTWKDHYGESLATIGIALQMNSDDIKTIIRTYIIRTRWNIEVVA